MRLRRLALALTLLVLLGGYVAVNFRTTTDISVFFPEGDHRQRAKLSKAIAQSELSRTLILTLESDNAAQAVAASKALEALLRGDAALMSQLAFLEGGPPQGVDRVMWQLYEPRRLSFVAPSVAEAEAKLSDAGLSQAVASLRQRLESPLSTLVSRVAPGDPFFTVPTLLERFAQGAARLAVEQERYIAQDRFAVLFVGTHASALNAQVQADVQNGIERAVQQLKQQYPDVRLEESGLARFALSTQKQIKRDITRISTFSVLGLAGFCWLLFRSFRLVYLLFLPIGAGMLAAIAASLLLFGSVHGITLAVGASLIGVGMDYVLHFYAHQLLSPSPGGPSHTMRRIGWGLGLGAGTTIVGFIALAGSSFPGLRQIATFAAVGVAVAFCATWALLPLLVPHAKPVQPLLTKLAHRLTTMVQWWHASPRRAWLVAASAVVASAVGVFTVKWQDSFKELTQADPAVYVEDARVRSRITGFDTSRVVLALGQTDEQALAVNEQLPALLRAAQAAGEIEGWQGLGTLLPSGATQTAIAETVKHANLVQRLPPILRAQGFDENLFAPYYERLRQAEPAPLRLADLLNSAAAPLVRSFHVELSDANSSQVAFITFLQGVDDVDALAHRIERVPGAVVIDQGGLMTDANRQYRTRTTELLLFGLVAVFVVLLLRYRRPKRALAAFAPALLSAGVTVAVLSALSLPLNLLGLTALLMVLSMGVDYGVFLTETALGQDVLPVEELGATLVGVFVSWLSTLFGFGLLALSEQPALRLIGVVAAVGVTSSFLLAPASLVLLRSPALRSKPV